jgi:hypothetical protein
MCDVIYKCILRRFSVMFSTNGLRNLNFCVIQLTLGIPKCVIRDPMSQHFNKFMRLNADNLFTLRVLLNCVYLLYYATS